MKKKKSELWLRLEEGIKEDGESTGYGGLFLFLRLPTKVYLLWDLQRIPDDDVEKYKDALTLAINEIFLIANSTGLKFKIDESVCEFIKGSENDMLQFVTHLVKEI